jgi:hypothetical protein
MALETVIIIPVSFKLGNTSPLQVLEAVLQSVHISMYAHLSVAALLLGYGETPAIWRTIFTFLPHGISITQNQTLISLCFVVFPGVIGSMLTQGGGTGCI